jgi:predicted phosphodiesterase
LDSALLDYLAGQPSRRLLQFGNKTVLMVHSTPWEPRGEYVYPHSARLARFAETEADYVLYGHTHAQVVRQVGRVLVINPGSAGDARDHSNDRQLSCAVLDTATDAVQIIDYPDPRFGGA